MCSKLYSHSLVLLSLAYILLCKLFYQFISIIIYSSLVEWIKSLWMCSWLNRQLWRKLMIFSNVYKIWYHSKIMSLSLTFIKHVAFESIKQTSGNLCKFGCFCTPCSMIVTFKHTVQNAWFCTCYHQLLNWLEYYTIDRTRPRATLSLSNTKSISQSIKALPYAHLYVQQN